MDKYESQLRDLEIEREKLCLDEMKFNLERERLNLEKEKMYFKKDLIECARRNVEVIGTLERSELIDKAEAKKQIAEYLVVMKNAIELNK